MPLSAEMWRNIIGQSILQVSILTTLLFKAGDLFGIVYKSQDPFYPDELDIDLNPSRTEWVLNEPTEKLHAYTIVFQTFVFMQIGNMINSRKISECNAFEDFFARRLFLVVLVAALSIQMLLVSFGGRLMRTYPLPISESAICLAIASSTMIWGMVIKAIPATWFKCLVRNKPEKVDI